MLKIKDNVDLKELEKFGYERYIDYNTGNYVYLKKRFKDFSYIGISEETRKIYDIFKPNGTMWYKYLTKLDMELIKDLQIQGLVEKVDV